MGTYAIIETGGEQLRVEPGRFYDIRHSAPPKPTRIGPSTKILIYRVLMIRRESTVTIGHPWVRNAIVRGRVLHPRLGNKLTIYKMISKKKFRRRLGHRQNYTRSVVDSIYLDGEEV